MKSLKIHAEISGLYHKINRELSNVVKHLVNPNGGAISDSEEEYGIQREQSRRGSTFRLLQKFKQCNLSLHSKTENREWI